MSDWRSVTIGELLTLEYGKPLPEAARDGQGFPVYGSNGIVGFHSQALVKGPGVVVGRKGSSGTVTFSESDFTPIDTAFYVSIKNRSEIGMEFVYHLLANAKLTELTTQTGVPGLSRSRAYEVRVAVPPLPVQLRIVEMIGAVDDQITALDAEAESLHAVLRRLRTELVDDQGVPTIRADEAFEIRMGRQRAPQYAAGPYMTPYLRSANVGYGTLDLTDVLEMNFDPKERQVFGLVPGDVLVSKGSASQSAVGMPAVWRGELPGPICFQKTLMRYRAIEGISVPAFVNHWCLWAYESGTFLDTAGGTNIKHITAMRAVRMPVRLPSVADQVRIAAELDTMSEAVAAVRAEEYRLRAVRARLLGALLDRTIDLKSAESES